MVKRKGERRLEKGHNKGSQPASQPIEAKEDRQSEGEPIALSEASLSA